MANKFQVKRTTVSGRTPNTTNSGNSQYIDTGELALNLTDGKMFSSNGTVQFEVGANVSILHVTNEVQIDNDVHLSFRANGFPGSDNRVSFVQQNDDNFVLYTSNTTGGTRPVWSVYANTNNSRMNFAAGIEPAAGIYANGGYGSAGQTLFSDGTSVYWGSGAGTGSVTSVGSGDGLSGGPITAAGTLSVNANNGVIANSSGLFVNQGTGLVVNSTGVHVNSSFISTLSSNNASTVGGNSALDLRSYSDTQSAAAYSNAVSYADTKAGAAYTNALSYAATTYAPLSGAVFTGSVNAPSFVTTSFTANTTGIIPVSNSYSLGSTANRWAVYGSTGTFSGAVTIDGNLTVSGNTITISSSTLSVTDNMFYMNQGISASVTNVVGNGSVVVFTANNNFANGWDVSVSSVNPSSFNGSYNNIVLANATHFTVANTNTDTYVSGGMARGKTDSNPDIGFAAGYNDGTYHHTGFFRDATDGYYKVFDNYAPEPDSSVFIDTSNTTFRIANFQANDIIGSTANISTSVSTANLVVTGNASVNNTLTLVSISANGSLGSTNQVLTTNGTSVYWGAVEAGGSTTTSDTPPVSPDSGDLWWDTENGRLYIYYYDGTSSQWVDASPGIPGPAGVDGVDGADGLDGLDGSGFTSSTDGEINSLGVGTPPSNVTGEIRAAATITAFYSSDERIKTNILDITNPIEKIKSIRGVTFKWTEEEVARRGGIDGKYVREEEVGVIAQEIQSVLPQIVAERPDGYLAVRYEMIVPLLIESIKEQQKQIEELKQIIRSM